MSASLISARIAIGLNNATKSGRGGDVESFEWEGEGSETRPFLVKSVSGSKAEDETKGSSFESTLKGVGVMVYRESARYSRMIENRLRLTGFFLFCKNLHND